MIDADRPASKEQLVLALRDPSTKGRRGSTLWALYDGKYDCSDLVPDLVDFVIEGNFEEVNHALSIMDTIDTDVPTAFIEATIDRLRSALGRATDWRRDALDVCLDIFESNQNTADVSP